MSEYNLGTASGRIEVDGRAAAVGFRVAETAAGAFFDVLKMRTQEVQRLGKRMAAVGTTGVVGFGVAINTAAKFEQQMSGVRAVTGSVGGEFDDLRQKALDLGRDTVYSASEAASAIEELAKAGIPVADILNGAADAAVALAAAGGIGIPEAATIAANAMNQFNMKAEEMADVTDALAGVANTSAADVSGIGQSLSQAGAVANLAGLSFRDTAIAIGEMADAGINGSDAGTSLKTMLNNLIPVTQKQITRFKDLNLLTFNLGAANKMLAKQGLPLQDSIEGVRKVLGKYIEEMDRGKRGSVKNRQEQDRMLMSLGGLRNQFFDAQGNVKDLAGLQGTLGKALKGMTKQQKLANLETLFGADAMRATAILSLAGRKGYEEFSEAVGKTKASEVAATRLDNLSGSVEAFKGSMETAMIDIGSIFLPVVTKIVNGATKLVNVFNNLPKGVKVAIGVLGLVASSGLLVVGMILALLPLILSMIANFLLMRTLGAVVTGIRAMWTALRAGQGVMVATQVGAARTGTAMATLGKRSLFGAKLFVRAGKLIRAALLIAMGPIGIAILAIAGLVALGVKLYKEWTPFRNLIDKIADILQKNFQKAWTALQPVIAAVTGVFEDFGQFLEGKFQQVWKALPGIISAAVAIFKEFANFVADSLLPVLTSVGKMLFGKIMKGWREISKAIGELMPTIDEMSGKFERDVIPAMDKVWGVIQPILSAFLDFAQVVGGKLLDALQKVGEIFIKYILPVLIKVAGFLTGVLIDAVVTLVKGLIQAVSGIIQIFSGLIDFFAGLFTGDWGRMWDGVKKIFTGIWDLIVGAIKVYLSVGILKVVGLAFKGLLAIVRLGWRFILNLFKAAGRGVWAIVRGAFNLVLRIIKGAANGWLRIIRGGWNLVLKIVRGVLNILKAIVSGIFRFIVSLIKGQVTAAKNIAVGGFRGMRDLVLAAVRRLRDGVVAIFKRVVDFVKGIPKKILDGLGNVKTLLYDAGKKIIQGLIDGIGKMVGKVGDAMKSVTDKIGGFLPGSPIKEGPLTSWNDGGAGRRLMDTLYEGVVGQRRTVAKAAAAVANAMNDSFANTLAFTDPSITGTMAVTPITPPNLSPARSRVAETPKSEGNKVFAPTINNPRPERATTSQKKALKKKGFDGGWAD